MTSTSIRHNNNKNDSHFKPSLNCTFEKKQLQKKFEHAEDFRVLYNYNPANRDLFQKKLIKHRKSKNACLDTYRSNEVYHYYDPKTNLNVIINKTNNEFISGLRLSDKQLTHIKLNGKIT